MKKQAIVLAFILCMGLALCHGGPASAQFLEGEVTPSFVAGDKVINVGIGLPSVWFRSYYRPSIPPVSVSFEMGYMDDFLVEDLTLGVGAYGGIQSYSYKSAFWDYRTTSLVGGLRGALHYPLIENLDTYTGLMLGLRVNMRSGDYTGNRMNLGIASSFYVGGRYYFSDNLAVFGEVGSGISYITGGLAMKFGN